MGSTDVQRTRVGIVRQGGGISGIQKRRFTRMFINHSQVTQSQQKQVFWSQPGKPVNGGSYCLEHFRKITGSSPHPPSLDDGLDIPQYDGNVTMDSDNYNSESEYNDLSFHHNCTTPQPIPVIIKPRQPRATQSYRVSANTIIKHSDKKVLTATQLPKVVNLNTRSVYNKKEEFKTMMEQLDVDLCCMSESWDRQNMNLEDILHMEGYQIVKNVLQRRGRGGKPALIIKKEKYHIKELCPTLFTVPPTVEATWALLTPKIQVNRTVKHIAVASVYYAKRTKRKDFIDHICEAYNVLLAKYGQGLHLIIAGDFNRINVNPILAMSPSLKQVVQIPTRMNPEATLDKIITTLSEFYLPPTSLPPLDNDTEGNGKPSDHLIIEMSPINRLETQNRNTKKSHFGLCQSLGSYK